PDAAAEEKIQGETKASVRCLPLEQPDQPGRCLISGRETKTLALFAQAY
ncbi:MAG: hypothetical protein KC591_15750, partial [Gemmatimonadetes bacterium]|nr:hypothetical protein [Gemmatimonadota bacterium]